MAKFEPLTKDEAEKSKSNLVDTGVYDFEVIDAEEKVSRNGNLMFELRLLVTWNEIGETFKLRDWIMIEGAMSWKLREFACDCLGMAKEYSSGTLTAEQFVGRTGRVETGHSKDGKFNEVVRYIDRNEKISEASEDEEIAEDEIPV